MLAIKSSVATAVYLSATCQSNGLCVLFTECNYEFLMSLKKKMLSCMTSTDWSLWRSGRQCEFEGACLNITELQLNLTRIENQKCVVFQCVGFW